MQSAPFGARTLSGRCHLRRSVAASVIINVEKTQYTAKHDHRTGASAKCSISGVDKKLSRSRRVDVRDVRRLLLQGPAGCVVGGGDTGWKRRSIYRNSPPSHRDSSPRHAARVVVSRTRRSLATNLVPLEQGSRRIKDLEPGKFTRWVCAIPNRREERARGGRVFIGIGTRRYGALKGQLAMHDNWVQDAQRVTHQRGGRVAQATAGSVYRQAVTAAGSGCMAAMSAERILSGSYTNPLTKQSIHHRRSTHRRRRTRRPGRWIAVWGAANSTLHVQSAPVVSAFRRILAAPRMPMTNLRRGAEPSTALRASPNSRPTRSLRTSERVA